MPNELPMYPTPQQATMRADQARKSNKAAQRPPKQNGYAQQQQYQYNPSIAPTPQQYYQQHQHQPMPQYHQPPTQHVSPPQQYAAPQQYYQPQPLPQPPQPQAQPTYYQPPQQPAQQPIQQQHAPQQHVQHAPQQHVQHAPRSQSHSSSIAAHAGHAQPQYEYQTRPSYSEPSHSHKKPPPSAAASPPRHSNRSKESLQESVSLKKSGKQKLEAELRSVFEKVDTNRLGRISARELSLALLNFDHTRFQDSTILLMIKLFSNLTAPGVNSKSLGFDQFVSLWKYLSAYKKLFVAADVNRSGDISFGEFQKIIEQIGYKLNIDLVLHLFQKFSNKDLDSFDNGTVGKLKFDAFIELLVYLRKLTDIFKKYDKDLTGVATIDFSDFLLEVSSLS